MANYLINEPSQTVAFAVAYGGRNSCIREADWRNKRAKNYLVEKHKVVASRIIVVDGGFRDNAATEIFLAASDGCGPFPAPSLAASRTQIRGFCDDKHKEMLAK